MSYSAFRDTAIGQLPYNWAVKNLGEIGSVKMCKRIFKHETSAEGDIPFFKIGTFGRTADAFISQDKYESFKSLYPYPRKGTPLISAAGTIGRIVIHNGQDAYYQDSNIVWLEHDESEVLDLYIRYYYCVIKWVTETGSAITRLYNNQLLSALIAVPSLKEQRAIATALSDMDALIEAKTALLEKKRAIKQGALQELLTGRRRLPGFAVTPMKQTDIGEIPEDWEIRHLGKVGSFFKGAGISKADLVGGGEPCIRYAELYTTYGNTCAVATPKSKADPDKVKVKANYGDIIFAGSGETFEDIGRALAYVGSEPIAVGGDTIIYTNHDFEPRFLGYVLNSPAIVRQKMTLATGTTIIHIHDKQLRMLITPHPDYEEQIAIADSLSEMELELDSLTTEITKLRDIKQGMMQELLTGRIRLVK